MSRYSHLTPLAVARRITRQVHRRTWPERFAQDDYDWREYPGEYAAELKRVAKRHTQRLHPGLYRFKEETLQKEGSAPDLHPNHRLLYETVLQLRPDSV